MSDWKIFHGDNRTPHAGVEAIGDPPPWRAFKTQYRHRATTFQAAPRVVEAVNAALYLRRPLLVTGLPGSGKSSIAYAVAHELDLGGVLKWAINSRSTRTQGLYEYDAIGRLRAASLARAESSLKPEGERQRVASHAHESVASPEEDDLSAYLRLGPLGTALCPSTRPRVLLVDEIDKSDLDFPNDLLNVLEEGSFVIPELARIADRTPTVKIPVYPDESVTGEAGAASPKVEIEGGFVQCTTFPFILITSNGERVLPPAFLRRCVRVDVPQPGAAEVRQIAKAHFDVPAAGNGSIGWKPSEEVEGLIARFGEAQGLNQQIAVDQLLSAIFLLTRDRAPDKDEREVLLQMVMKALNEG